ncbi:hypothetical protein DV701_09305 [Ornithinimicrobium avium]|uniref:Uncharacterized protein n=2 Tax=Ornithinimicrobium avium TaxID=2283195 RepID=A0A345NMN1_9MICO|nr:hypothetical protein DV701_09305 [Ornithinimicrobium avium]
MPSAPRSVFHRWIDDAAVFPPGCASVPDAWAEHLALREGRYADLLGPLLIGTPGAEQLVAAAAQLPPAEDLGTGTAHGSKPVDVTVVARAGTPLADLVGAVGALRGSPHVQVVGVELAHDDEAGRWRRALDLGVRVAVEVTRDPAAQQAALDDLAAAAGESPVAVLAKLRTQATSAAPPPTPGELAGFLLGARARGLALKLTGGLHRAVAHTTVAGTDEHGALNVLVAVHHLEEGAALPELVATLELRDAEELAALVRGLEEEAVALLRRRFVSFGCCGVLDPVHDLLDLGLLT